MRITSKTTAKWATAGCAIVMMVAFSTVANAQGTLYVTGDQVGVGESTPAAKLHVKGPALTGPAGNLALLEGDTGPYFTLQKTGSGAGEWYFLHENNSPNRFIITASPASAGPAFAMTREGALTIKGTLTTSGTCSAGLCDGVFLPSYDVPSIEEHAEYMWENSHLKGVGATPETGPVNISQKVGGILNELEHAHIYIEQLNAELREKSEAISGLQSRLDRLESLILEQ